MGSCDPNHLGPWARRADAVPYRDVKGVDGREMGRSPLLPIRGSGEHCKLPWRGPGKSPAPKTVLVHFSLKEHI